MAPEVLASTQSRAQLIPLHRMVSREQVDHAAELQLRNPVVQHARGPVARMRGAGSPW